EPPVKGARTPAAAVENELVEAMHHPLGDFHFLQRKIVRMQRIGGEDLLDEKSFHQLQPELALLEVIVEFHLQADEKTVIWAHLYFCENGFAFVDIAHLAPQHHLD